MIQKSCWKEERNDKGMEDVLCVQQGLQKAAISPR